MTIERLGYIISDVWVLPDFKNFLSWKCYTIILKTSQIFLRKSCCMLQNLIVNLYFQPQKGENKNQKTRKYTFFISTIQSYFSLLLYFKIYCLLMTHFQLIIYNILVIVCLSIHPSVILIKQFNFLVSLAFY